METQAIDEELSGMEACYEALGMGREEMASAESIDLKRSGLTQVDDKSSSS